MGIAALVLGIISIVMSLFTWLSYAFPILGAIIGIVAVILGGLARKDPNQSGIGTAGLICGIVGASLCIVFGISCAACACIAEQRLRSMWY